MPQSIPGTFGSCLPVSSSQFQKARERAEIAAIARGFSNPEAAGELAVRRAMHLMPVQR